MDSLIKLAAGVRVRQEDFGLIFYDAKKSDICLVKSGDLISPLNLNGTCTREYLVSKQPEIKQKSVLALLESLRQKGLICEQPLS
jgi:putative mycofactocin binding protein MftB